MTKTISGFVKRGASPLLVAVLLIVSTGFSSPLARAQGAAASGAAPDLQTLVGPIALYPDDLIAVVLPASTYPVQIVEAARFLDQHEQNRSLRPDPSWDDSVVALLNYPEVLHMMSANLNWASSLGQAVIDSQADVMDAIQAFRERAYAAGNLRSDDRQTVTEESDGTIQIQPVDPEVVYIPYYQPERVVVYEPVPVLHYYAHPFPLYYYPYPAGYSFSINFFWGVTSAFSIGWRTHVLDYCAPGFRSHPYYGHSYYAPYYVRRRDLDDIGGRDRLHVWRPDRERAARPQPRRIVSGSRHVNHYAIPGRRAAESHDRFAAAYRGHAARTSIERRRPTTPTHLTRTTRPTPSRTLSARFVAQRQNGARQRGSARSIVTQQTRGREQPPHWQTRSTPARVRGSAIPHNASPRTVNRPSSRQTSRRSVPSRAVARSAERRSSASQARGGRRGAARTLRR